VPATSTALWDPGMSLLMTNVLTFKLTLLQSGWRHGLWQVPGLCRGSSAEGASDVTCEITSPKLKPKTDLTQYNQNSTFQQLYGEAKANHTGIFACDQPVC